MSLGDRDSGWASWLVWNVLKWSMIGFIFFAVAIVGALLLPIWPARAHDDASWIGEQAIRNSMGEWCCSVRDCQAEPHTVTQNGYSLQSGELIPFSETMPLSPDGKLWVCRRPDKSRRCVFDRPPGS